MEGYYVKDGVSLLTNKPVNSKEELEKHIKFLQLNASVAKCEMEAEIRDECHEVAEWHKKAMERFHEDLEKAKKYLKTL